MRVRFGGILLVMVCVPGLASAQSPPADSPRACAVQSAGIELSSWQEVRAEGFTFCLPQEWRAQGGRRSGSDPKNWRSGRNSLSWGRGQYRPQVRTTTAVVRADELQAALQRPVPPVQRARDEIGGGAAEMWEREVNGTVHSGAQWDRPVRIYLAGEAQDPETAALLRQVYRTVRFTTSAAAASVP